MIKLKLDLNKSEYLELCDILKIANLCQSGGEAKHFITEGKVKVDGIVETRKRCKIRLNQMIEFEGEQILII